MVRQRGTDSRGSRALSSAIRLIVDASVATKWLFDEDGSLEADRLRDPSYDLVAPDFLHLEVANVVWKRVRQGRLPIDSGGGMLRLLRTAPVRMHRSQAILDVAWEIATRLGRTVYDSLYLALAVTLDGRVVTADRRFYDAVARSAFAESVLWIGDVPE